MTCHPHALHWLRHPDVRSRFQSDDGLIWISDIFNRAVLFSAWAPTRQHLQEGTPCSHKDQVCPSKRPLTNLMLALNYTNGYEASDMKISLEEFRGSKIKIAQVTYLSALRPDAHRGREKHDCSHWCLPGVPDTWSSIVYNYIMKSSMFLRAWSSIGSFLHVMPVFEQAHPYARIIQYIYITLNKIMKSSMRW